MWDILGNKLSHEITPLVSLTASLAILANGASGFQPIQSNSNDRIHIDPDLVKGRVLGLLGKKATLFSFSFSSSPFPKIVYAIPIMKKVAGVVNYVRHQANQLYQSPTRTLAVLEVFWDFSRRYFYALAFWSIFGAKLLHIFAHLYSLPLQKFIIWGPSFFFQDVAILLLFRILVQKTSGVMAGICGLIVLPSR